MPDSIYNKSLPALRYSSQNILVVGDLMLDSYWQGLIERISPEAPVPIVHVEDKTMRIGGAGNVAVNISSLGAKVSLMSVVGKDEAAQHLADLLDKTDVNNHCIQSDKLSTTIKLRVLSQHQQLIRLDFESTTHSVQYSDVSESYVRLLKDSDIVVLSDYGKGMLADAASFIQQANTKNIKVLVDPKHKDFSRYKGAYLITPNKKEFEAAVGAFQSQEEMVQKARMTINECDLGGMLVTQGEKGMTLIVRNEEAVHFPARAQEVFDVTGAGDTVIASLATGLSAGLSVQDAVHLSSIAAAIVVGRVGTASVTLEEVRAAEHSAGSIDLSSKVLNQQDVEKVVRQARVQHKKVVMTNGCFDLMHAGHVRYLEQAARLGDILIVAVNSDASVQKLKGKDRPINQLEDRMTVLAGLASVSLVVPFEEETPEQLICRIKPDILVKGSDYQKHQIAGAQCAGEVHLVSLVDGKSTTNMVEKIKQIK